VGEDGHETGVPAPCRRLADGCEPGGAAGLSGRHQNFIDRAQPDWQNAYYGKNLTRLTEIKRRYDRGNVFRFQQSIPRAA
jgi:hypothetical protein